MNGGELIAQVLKAQGVKHLFTLCGGHISPILVGSKKQGIRVIDVRQEPTAVFAADAVSRLTGIPGVAAVTAGPGITNSITAIKNAQMAESPLILLGGAVATILKGRGALQDIEQIKLFKTITKWTASIEQDCDIVPVLEEAFDVAKSGVPGPVFVECPIDTLYDEKLVKKWYNLESGSLKKDSLKTKAINWYIRRHADKLFACSNKSQKISDSKEIIPFLIQEEDVEKVASQINNFKNPILILGSQAMLRVEDVSNLADSIKKIGIPVYLTGMARGLLSIEHPLNFQQKRSTALKEADLVILAGMPMDFRLNYGRAINKKAFLISINRSKESITKNRTPNLGIQSDPSVFLQELAQVPLHDKLIDDWIDFLKNNEDQGKAKIHRFSNVNTEYINPLILCREINKFIDENSTIIGDGGDFVATVSYTIKPRKPLHWMDPGPFGTLGIGAGFALAAKLVRPEEDIWLLYGDGAAGYGLMEFDTFVRHKIPIISIIGNDAGWTQITRDQVQYLADDVGTVLTYSDYHKVGESLGAKGYLINKKEQIAETLQEAKMTSRKGIPVLINALIGKTDFRKGSISM